MTRSQRWRTSCGALLLLAAGCAPSGDPPGQPAVAPGRYMWAQRFGSIADDHGEALAVGPDGDLVVSGFFNGKVDFGGGPLSGTGKETAFVACYTAAGQHLWSRALGGTDYVEALGVALDAGKNVVVAGVFSATADLGTGPLVSAGAGDIFVAKYAATDGRPLWVQRYGGTGDDRALGVAVDGDGDVVVTGLFQGTADLGRGPLTSMGRANAFLAKYAGTDGMAQWTRAFPGTGSDSGIGVVVGPSKDVFLTGLFTGTTDMGIGPLPTAGGSDVFLARYTTDGGPVWAQRFGGTGDEVVTAMALDGSGELVVSGLFSGPADLGAGPVQGAGNIDLFLVRRAASDGHLLWARNLGGPGEDVASAVAADGSDAIAVAGSFEDTADLGAGPLTSAGGPDVFVGEYAISDGSARWTRGFGGQSGDYALAVGVHPDHAVSATGAFAGVADFGGGPLSSAGRTDAFVLHLGP